MIPQSFIADLLNRVDIVEVVGRHVTLKKAGANYQGLCPFHNEKSPSFSVSPTKQFYHCFGCGAHGSAISFMMEHSGLTYVDAIEELARSAGLTVPREERRPQDLAKQKQALALSEVMGPAADWYKQQLKGAPKAIDYLKRRGLSGEIAKRFGMGYAPDAWQGLEAVFGTYGEDALANVLVEAGLVIQSESKRYDRFRDRIMFPIRNPKGQVIAFGGRILDAGEPKYLNSPETPLFSKGNTLYGLFEARQAIRDKGYVIVCEGYMDVVALAQLGFANGVATLGTACTSNHVRSLMRQSDRIVFSFDGDSAGQRAAKRALEACLPMMADDKEVKFLFLPEEHDPDSFVREKGAEAFEQAISQAMPLSSFFIHVANEGHDWNTPEGRAQTQHAAKPMLLAMPAIALRAQLVRELAQKIGITSAELENFCGLKSVVDQRPAPTMVSQPSDSYMQTASNANGKKPWNKKTQIPKGPPPTAPTDLAEQILRIILQYPALARELSAEQKRHILASAKKRSDKAMLLMEDLILQCEAMPPNVGFAVFQEQLEKTAFAKSYAILRDRIMSTELTEDAAKEDFEGTLKKLEQLDLKDQMTEIAARIASGKAKDEDKALYRLLMAKLK
ncbi:DNA primase [Polynucleobacter sp. 30F-ANTBAC]|uniref:DNA primase n=1 Tax=Polynucleobacter sp. 30F-ANTBAC TaxID=2689095 RepID=UPI001C0AC69A|nr:DNA primase [Polynucleobacter sp. 30F-ANTBAC]MBU3600379.1 DNA primase [Polynucleobacter sp. 30F-ANTBAC]